MHARWAFAYDSLFCHSMYSKYFKHSINIMQIKITSMPPPHAWENAHKLSLNT